MASDLKGVPFEGEIAELLNKTFISKVRIDGYLAYRGVTLPARHSVFADRIENFEVRDDDVWVISYPKTGTTWTQEMVWCIENNLDFEGAKEMLPQRFPFLDHSSLFDYDPVIKEHPDAPFPFFVRDAVTYFDNLKPKRFIKTHFPWPLLPKQIRDGTKKPKIIYVCRNPKDTCISYYHHCILLEGYTGDFPEFFKLFVNDAVCYSPFWSHVSDFWDRRNQDNVLFLKYEDMRKDLPSVVRKTSEFLEKSLSDEQVDVLCDHLSFQKMKNNQAVNFEPILEINRLLKLAPDDGAFMRKGGGTGGEWKDKMTPQMIEVFDTWMKKNAEKTNLHIWDL